MAGAAKLEELQLAQLWETRAEKGFDGWLQCVVSKNLYLRNAVKLEGNSGELRIVYKPN